MATADSFDAEPTAFENAVFEYSFDHVLAASGRVTAGGRRQGRDKGAVDIDREEENFSNESFPLEIGHFIICTFSHLLGHLLIFTFTHFLIFSFSGACVERWGLGGDFFQGFGYGFFDDGIRLFLFVHVVEGEEVVCL